MEIKENVKYAFQNPKDVFGDVGKVIVGFLGIALIAFLFNIIGSFVVDPQHVPQSAFGRFFGQMLLGLLTSMATFIFGTFLFIICREFGKFILDFFSN